MKSKASVRRHPIHPALIPFPFAFLLGSVLFDIGGWLTGTASYWVTAGHLAAAGLVSGVLAAIPGVIDFIYTVPPQSSARRRATRHALANVTALVCFAAIWWLRGFGQPPSPGALAVEALGAAALAYGGWQGGVLVNRNMVGVDHRHAESTKWTEGVFPSGGAVVVAKVDELRVGQMKLVWIGGRRLVLARTPDGYRACDDRCSHRGASLSDGVLIGSQVQCLWHGSRFDCTAGAVTCGPAREPVRTYPVRETPEGVSVILGGPPPNFL